MTNYDDLGLDSNLIKSDVTFKDDFVNPLEVDQMFDLRGLYANKISTLGVVGSQIRDGAITSAKIGSGAIGSLSLADASVTTAKLANLAVDNGKLALLAVDAAQLANSSVTSTKIANLAVGSAAIAAAAIGTSHIANAAITTALIANAAITNALINDLDAGKINAGTISADRIGANSITAAKIVAGTITSTEISSSYVYAGTINADNITSGTITGRTLRTASSGKRVVIDGSTNEITFYDNLGSSGSLYYNNSLFSFDNFITIDFNSTKLTGVGDLRQDFGTPTRFLKSDDTVLATISTAGNITAGSYNGSDISDVAFRFGSASGSNADANGQLRYVKKGGNWELQFYVSGTDHDGCWGITMHTHDL